MSLLTAPRRARGARPTALATILAVLATPLALGVAAPAQADVSTKINAYPYTQDWSNAALITLANDWSGVTGVQGYRGDALSASAGTDPQTVLADGSATPTNVIANNAASLSTNSTGGIIEHEPSQAIALQGSGTADAPHLVFHLDLTGKPAPTFAFKVKDLDGGADNAVQRIATQYRIGTTGDYTNLPDGSVADATEQNLATKVTDVSVVLPPATAGAADVFVRVITNDAGGADEWVGIDDISVTSVAGPLAATDPGDKASYADRNLTPFTLQATGGASPYTWEATGMPAGITVAADGLVSGMTSVLGTHTVTATVTDDADATAQTSFDLVVSEVPVDPFHSIPEIQGTGATSPFAVVGPESNVSTSGVVTASYPDGGLNGFVIQTPGYDPASDTDPDASNGLFVYQGGSPSYTPPAVGEFVTISSGKVVEFFGLTELTVTNGDFVESRPATPEEEVLPGVVVPGTDCALTGETTDCLEGAALAEVREKHESEIFLPTAPFTVSDSYDGSPWAGSSSSNFGEIGLAANDDEPLMIPVDEANPATDAAAYNAHVKYNAAKMLTLDDGAGISISGSANTSTPYPWLTKTHTVRVGAAVEFVKPVVFEYRNNIWKLIPQNRVQPGSTGEDQVSIEQDQPGAPDEVGGNIKIATFNMLNYFVHAAQDWDNLPNDAVGTTRSCTYYTDRASTRITANNCTWKDLRNNPPSTLPDIGPRGAATETSLLRQEGKEVAAINTMAADVMSLEEVENPVKIGYADRDAPLTRLVAALNADWAANHDDADDALGDRWAVVASPRPEAQPTIAEQDAIRNAFIYNPRVITTVGRSQILLNSPAMRNAREPLAQAFRHVDGTRDDGFIVIANHFKSKGAPDDLSTVAGTDNADAGLGSGFYNGDRIRQARALDTFAKSVAEDKDIPAVFMTGDYNAYGAEDPVRVLEAAEWTNLEPTNGESSYSFGGLAGSLDHVFANPAGLAMVTGQTIWPINANESVYYEYSRYNYNVADLFDGTTPFRSSDHNPEIIGINAPINPGPTDVDTFQVLASNDFHGRLLDDPASAAAGAAAMAGAVQGLRDPVTGNPNTVFAMAGDIVGASTFESFIQNDKPTIDAMNEAGLEVSAAGNHEFDQGYDDLMDRIMSVYDATDNPEGGANWPYIAANVRDAETGAYALDTDRTDGHHEHSNGATWWKTFPGIGDDGIRVGFVGAVTEDLDSLVAPSAIDGLEITSIVDEVNDAADTLKVDGCGGVPCDLVIELVHEGAPSPSCDTIKTDTTSTFGQIVHGANDNVDAIVSGHTHLKYNCKVDQAGTDIDRPVVSAGQYGSYLNQLEFDFETGTDNLVGIRQHVLAMKDYDEDAPVKAIVNAAVDVAAVEGQVELGQVEGPFKRARRTDTLTAGSPIVENRGGESTLGNLVAEIQRWRTGADIGVMNPGGLRDDLLGTDNAAGPVSYREAANVQPFANTLFTTELTGAQVKLLLEQQWQRDPDGNIPSRPFLRLGTSEGFSFTEDSSKPEGSRITGMWLDGVPIDPSATYTVAANSFVAAGGDNFRAFTLGTGTQDTGFTDLQATVDYLDEFANTSEGDSALPVDFAQHGVGARVPAGPHAAGETVSIPVDSLSMTGDGDVVDTAVTASYNGVDLDTETVVTTLPTQPFDTPGTATVSFTMPVAPAGTAWIKLTGATGTVAWLPVESVDSRVESTVAAPAVEVAYDQAGSVVATVTPAGASGTVTFSEGPIVLGVVDLSETMDGTATYEFIAKSLSVGVHTLTLDYSGSAVNQPSTNTVEVTVNKATSTVTATAADITWGQAGSVVATVTPAGATGIVELYDGATKIGEGTLATSAGTTTTTIAVAAGALGVGSHDLSLTYSGESVTKPAEGSVTVTVSKAATTVAGPPATIQWSKGGRIAVRVTPTSAPGTVELYNGGTRLGAATLADGAASIVVGSKALPVGTHTLVVRYLGNATYAASQGTVTVTVTNGKQKS